MTLDELLDVSPVGAISHQDITAYHAASGLTLVEALDAIARSVAGRYDARMVGYSKADAIMNGVFAFAATKGIIPPFMFSVFQAFDAGEFYPDTVRDPSPEERFTRPLISAILANDKTV